TLKTVPITGKDSRGPVQLQDVVGEPKITSSAVEVNHLALARVIDVYANVQGRDVGSAAADIEKALSPWGKKNPGGGSVASWSVVDKKSGKVVPGYAVKMRGEVASMKESFASLGFGLILAVVLIYLIMVAQFRSFLDPFIILFAVPLGLIGVLAMLAAT